MLLVSLRDNCAPLCQLCPHFCRQNPSKGAAITVETEFPHPETHQGCHSRGLRLGPWGQQQGDFCEAQAQGRKTFESCPQRPPRDSSVPMSVYRCLLRSIWPPEHRLPHGASLCKAHRGQWSREVVKGSLSLSHHELFTSVTMKSSVLI